ncbi:MULTISPECIES: tRNA uracil 4-sulfurtransferase ThiI [unclassified Paenibacillus]|uniref:tRNA uracil 4-sulfurtransferase ThiI n=1 Tax=unclassified Paenibacillus TaxID=185978 RepID=UPI001C0FF644|nr:MULTISPECIES: tRNA uracil 4-sulfurtransferase ThiI [unclassified Paenibacillus]MBU5440484.1 tRNA 4-thiouridine(8) synthase ThiI [Paenibacillus sp. MSJ-34]CAH0119593.1 putative tRNA sulfurtransferase [Paenibacillus sp. CECT 9249]
MNYDMILVRFGEFTIKGKNRTRFENTMLRQVQRAMAAFPEASIIKEYGRLYVALNGMASEPVIAALRNVFGIVSLSPVKRTESVLESIQTTAKQFIERIDFKPGTTFKVNARRVWKQFPHGSQEMNHLVASPILQTFPGLKVDVRRPDIELRVEIRHDYTYIYYETIPAVGGFPYGSNGKAMLLLSGGIDSPVAGWQALRRGLAIEAVHFHSYPFTSERAKQKVIDLAQVLAGYAGEVRLHLVPFTEIQTRLTQTGHDNLIITLMRRAMLRIATLLAEKQGALALVTGDSLGQVASQTLGSMNVIGKVTDLPLLRPLVMMDKSEITKIAQDIGTYELSILPYEDCCTLFVPKNPSTNPNLNIVELAESSIENLQEMIRIAADTTETLVLKDEPQPQLVECDDDRWF